MRPCGRLQRFAAVVAIACCLSACGGKVDSGASSTAAGSTGGSQAGSTNTDGANQAGTGSTGASSSGGTYGNVSSGGYTAISGGNVATAGTSGTGGNSVRGGTAACGMAACGSNGCGQLIDGCGNTVHCGYGNCVNGNASLCGTISANACTPCTPLGTAAADCSGIASGTGQKCDLISDGCGWFINCGACPSGQCCGCGGVPSVCGTPNSDSGAGCTPLTCGDYPQGTCGLQPDGCGGMTEYCGTRCDSALTCEQSCYARSVQCSSTNDGANYVVPCIEPDGCGGLQWCWCKTS
jgi:hypothetical protein